MREVVAIELKMLSVIFTVMFTFTFTLMCKSDLFLVSYGNVYFAKWA